MKDKLQQQKELYDQVWKKGLSKGKEQRGNLKTNLDFLKKTALLKKDEKILEIGCGIGSVVSALSKQRYDVTGTDISREAISYGRKKYGDIKLQVEAAERLSFEDQSFGFVLSFDLFEHIAEVDRHLSEVYRVLKPGGYYLFQTPNKYSNALFSTISHKSLKWRRAHPSLHSPRQLRRRLKKHGFNVDFIKMNPVNEFTLKKLEKFGVLKHIFRYIKFESLPLSLQTNLYVIARKI